MFSSPGFGGGSGGPRRCGQLALGSGERLDSRDVGRPAWPDAPWFAQVGVDSGRAQLRDLVLYKDALYAQTDKAVIHALDAETGKTLWCKQVGQARYPSMPPDANRDLLAVVNGSRLYVLNRYNGKLLYQREIEDAPDAGPVLSSKRVYIPMSNGKMIAYRLDVESESQEEGPKTRRAPRPRKRGHSTPIAARMSASANKCCRRCFANPLGKPWCSPCWCGRTPTKSPSFGRRIAAI